MRQPTYYLCHGGGPWPWLQGPLRQALRGLERGLQAIPEQLPEEPRAILVVSAHWEEPVFTVTTAPQPAMVYDYFGFPPESYAIRYPSEGSPALAARVTELLESAGLHTAASPDRGYDHGTYSVLQPLYPQARIPVIQLSVQTTLDPLEHLLAGQALAPLRNEGVLIIGSGMSCHERGPDMALSSALFDDWLQDTLVSRHDTDRWDALCEWERAPHARLVHPREDHLIPLMVAAGAADGEPAECIYRERLMGFIAVSSYRFGA